MKTTSVLSQPPILTYLFLDPVGEAGEEAKEKQKVPPMRRLSRMLSNAGPALVRRVSKLRRKSLARE